MSQPVNDYLNIDISEFPTFAEGDSLNVPNKRIIIDGVELVNRLALIDEVRAKIETLPEFTPQLEATSIATEPEPEAPVVAPIIETPAPVIETPEPEPEPVPKPEPVVAPVVQPVVVPQPALVQPEVLNITDLIKTPTALAQNKIDDTLEASMAASKKPKSQKSLWLKLAPALSGLATFLILLAAFNAPIWLEQLHYSLSKPAANTAAITAQPASADTSQAVIYIPQIDVNAPIVFDPSIDETSIENSLENGVVHYATTPDPGQPGNSVIVGHSSNNWWDAGNYKFVFVLLDKLNIGDQFTVYYKGERYEYQVTSTQIVAPTDMSVLDPTPTPTLTLITCTPPGTSWQRLVVTSKQVSPLTPAQTATPQAQTAQKSSLQLPDGSNGILAEIGNVVVGIENGLSTVLGHTPAAQTTIQTQSTSTSANTNATSLPATN